MGSEAMERYKKLGLGEALGRSYDYAPACTELSFILRGAYSDLPKRLQSLVFHDTLAALRLLPEVLTSSGMSAANLLLQASEVALPKRKKALVVSEFKHAVIAHKRCLKAQQDAVQQHEGGARQLPRDVLIHIFSFLDMRSIVVVGLVCRAWNSAANDNTLWRLQYSLLFGDYDTCSERKEQIVKAAPVTNLDWRTAFKRKYARNSSWRSASTRGYCGNCKSIIWLSNICANSHQCSKLVNQPLKIKPRSPHVVVEYLLDKTVLTMSSSDSDSDSDGSSPYLGRLPRLWACPLPLSHQFGEFMKILREKSLDI